MFHIFLNKENPLLPEKFLVQNRFHIFCTNCEKASQIFGNHTITFSRRMKSDCSQLFQQNEQYKARAFCCHVETDVNVKYRVQTSGSSLNVYTPEGFAKRNFLNTCEVL